MRKCFAVSLLFISLQWIVFQVDVSADELSAALESEETEQDAKIPFNPAVFRTTYEKATVELRQGKTELAKQDLRTLLQMKPSFGPAHHFLGMIYIQEGDFVKAKAHLEDAVTASPNDFNTRYLYATSLAGLGKIDKAIPEYEKAIVLDPNSMRAYNDLGVVYLRQGKWAQSIEKLKKALELSPNSAATMMVLGISYIRDKKPEHAIEMILELRRVKDETKADALEKMLRESEPSAIDPKVLQPGAPAANKRSPGNAKSGGGATASAQVSIHGQATSTVQQQQAPKKKKSKNPFAGG